MLDCPHSLWLSLHTIVLFKPVKYSVARAILLFWSGYNCAHRVLTSPSLSWLLTIGLTTNSTALLPRLLLLQIPLELGWGITVHKCQGMTLDAVQINLEKAFEPGMAYVALRWVHLSYDESWVIVTNVWHSLQESGYLIVKEPFNCYAWCHGSRPNSLKHLKYKCWQAKHQSGENHICRSFLTRHINQCISTCALSLRL